MDKKTFLGESSIMDEINWRGLYLRVVKRGKNTGVQAVKSCAWLP